MGFETRHDGVTGKKDVLIVAPIGMEHYRFTVEAKGSKDSVGNIRAVVGSAAAHRDEVEARLAVVVAREFVGFERTRQEPPAILQECRSTRGVSIATVEVLEELHDAIHEYGYPLSEILPVLAEIESPDDKLERVRALQRPVENFDYRRVLNDIWERQQGEAQGDVVPYRTVWQNGPEKWGLPDFKDFQRRLLALETLSGLMKISTGREQVTLLQNPEIVAERIRSALEARKQEEEAAADLPGVGS